jgi:hypothetical protein
MKKFGHLEVGQIYKGIVQQDRENILKSLLWWHLVISSVHTIIVQGFFVNLSVWIESNQKVHLIWSALDLIRYKQKLSIP